jgi:hypothetical protein
MSKELEIDFSGQKLAICIPVYTGQVGVSFVTSLISSVVVMKQLGLDVVIYWEQGNAIVQSARDRLVNKALSDGATKIMFIDSDIVFTDDDLMRLLGFSTYHPIVAAAYPARKDPPTFIVSIPDIKNLNWNEHGLLEVEGLGFGFVVIDSSVFNAMEPNCSKYDDAKAKLTGVVEYFKVGVVDGKLIGEDVHFFKHASELGFPIWLDASINLGHLGQKQYSYPFKKVLFDKQAEILD